MIKNNKLDYDAIASLSLDINKLIGLIVESVPNDNNELLRHLASASIHIALFMQDVCSYKETKEIHKLTKLQQSFLDNCGCKKE